MKPLATNNQGFKDAPDNGIALSADGVPVHYEIHGEGSPALIFVHGWCCDRSYWQQQIDAFASHYTVVAIDLAGHGASGQGRSQWTIPAFAQDVVAVVEQLGLTGAILIGHSMGGPVIVEAARQMPARVRGLVGADTLLNPERNHTQEEIAAEVAPFCTDFIHAMREMVGGGMFVATSDPLWAESIVQDMASAPPTISIGALEELRGFDEGMRAGLRSLQAPLVLINSDFEATNFAATDRFGIEVHLMSRVGHFVMLEDAQSFNRLLEATVRKMIASTVV